VVVVVVVVVVAVVMVVVVGVVVVVVVVVVVAFVVAVVLTLVLVMLVALVMLVVWRRRPRWRRDVGHSHHAPGWPAHSKPSMEMMSAPWPTAVIAWRMATHLWMTLMPASWKS
jgi:hypothetical protein